MNRALLLWIFVPVLGCSSLTVHRSEPRPLQPQTTVVLHSFLWGFAERQNLTHAQDICGKSHVEKLEFSSSTLEVLIVIFSLGLYTPHHVTVSCSEVSGTKTASSNSRQ